MTVEQDKQIVWFAILNQPGLKNIIYTIDVVDYGENYVLNIFTCSSEYMSLNYYKTAFGFLRGVAQGLGIDWIVIYRGHNDPEYSGEPMPQAYFKFEKGIWKYGVYNEFVNYY